MKRVMTFALWAMLFVAASQAQNLNLPTASKKAAVVEYIGISKVAIDYHRPGVKGREGKIYGTEGIVPYDGGKPMPWRAGADENTTIYFQDDVAINGQALKAGKYGFHIIPAETEWTLIFSKNNYSWGSYFYDAAEDVLRITVKPETCEMTEWLTYEFANQKDNSADVRLRWERKQITFTVSADVPAITIASLGKELDGAHGFRWESYVAAVQYCLAANKDIEQALAWSERALDVNFGGQENFQTLSTKAQVLDKMGKTAEAMAIIDRALPLGTVVEVHFYARSLIAQNKNEEALKVFKLNREKHPDDNFTTFVGLARGHKAVGQFKEAAQFFRKAAPNAPEGQATIYEDLAKECEAKLTKQGG